MSIKLKTFIILHDKKFLNKIKKMLHVQHLYLIGSLSGFPWPLGNFFGVFFTFLIIIIFLSNSFPTFNLSILSNLPPKTSIATFASSNSSIYNFLTSSTREEVPLFPLNKDDTACHLLTIIIHHFIWFV